MKFVKAITMTAYRRPEYTEQVLKALAKCYSIEEWTLIVGIDHGPSEVVDVVKEFDACELIYTINPGRMGLNENTNSVIRRATALHPNVLTHIEDDIVLSRDALLYFEWAVREVLIPDIRIKTMLASGYNKPEKKPKLSESHTCMRRPVWTPWGWAVDHRRMLWMLHEWKFRNPKCFTCYFKKKYQHSLIEVYPLLSRVQNIGYEKGENDRTPEWYRENHRAPWTAGPKTAKETAMDDNLKRHQIKFHIDKIAIIKKEIETRKNAGAKRIMQAEGELRQQVDRLEHQIKIHEGKIKELSI